MSLFQRFTSMINSQYQDTMPWGPVRTQPLQANFTNC